MQIGPHALFTLVFPALLAGVSIASARGCSAKRETRGQLRLTLDFRKRLPPKERLAA